MFKSSFRDGWHGKLYFYESLVEGVLAASEHVELNVVVGTYIVG